MRTAGSAETTDNRAALILQAFRLEYFTLASGLISQSSHNDLALPAGRQLTQAVRSGYAWWGWCTW